MRYRSALGATVGMALGASASWHATCNGRDINAFRTHSSEYKLQAPTSAAGKGEISTHVISKLGSGSIAGAAVRVHYHPDLSAGALTAGWKPVASASLSANGGIDDLVPVGSLRPGLYLVEYDLSGVDSWARRIYRKDGTSYAPLNPTGFFLADRTALTLKVEDADSLNHLVLSVGEKELTVRPGVRAH